MLKCLVVDDEQLAVDVITDYIPRVPFLKLAATYNNPVEALMHLQKEKIDLIFLYIQDIRQVYFYHFVFCPDKNKIQVWRCIFPV